ncbi:MAG TPA: DUF5110 domain-containing protein, partial [Terracidiphilus sp.]|nr:DUF5110 domain-containing protein [Terracidiphilus sp.]
SSQYSLYADNGVSVEYQHGVFTRTPIHATETGDTLRIEIGPVDGSFPGMLKTRSYELRLPADWPPASVTVDGKPVPQRQPGRSGWSFIGNTLTTVIPTPSFSTASKVIIEVHRAPGSVARRSQLDGFSGAMTRLRAAYDAMQQTWPVSAPPDALIDVMQTGDRLGYHPERAAEEIAHFHNELPKAQAAITAIALAFEQNLSTATHIGGSEQVHINEQTREQQSQASFARAQALMKEVGNE